MQTSHRQLYCVPEHSPSYGRNKLPSERGGRNTYAYQKLRLQVLAEESSCWLCELPVDQSLKHPDPGSPEADHVVPIEAGGARHDRANLRLAHQTCNRRRRRPKSPLG